VNRSATALVSDCIRRAIREDDHYVVAVSGGRDSMVLLEALARVARDQVACVATYDHGTGSHAERAVELVRAHCQRLELPFTTEASRAPAAREADWRAQRHSFLRAVAERAAGRIMTAHTRDDQVETVLMRAMRGAGARGLAGLFTPSGIVRPFIGVRRATITSCATSWRVPFVDDPSNVSRAHLRNRIRLDLLPALRAVDRNLERDLLMLSRRAAALRSELNAFVEAHLVVTPQSDRLDVDLHSLTGMSSEALCVLWPAIAARHGVTLDRRGTERLTAFTIRSRTGARIQVSGGVDAVRHRDRISLRRVPKDTEPPVLLEDGARWGPWRFVRAGEVVDTDRWVARLPVDVTCVVRAWRPGDRMLPEGGVSPRRLKGLFRDADVDVIARRHWPVVVAGDEVVWVPGVRRASAAADRSGRPTVTYRCERLDR
jgi:tRNA(Ile)-lysidine synthase